MAWRDAVDGSNVMRGRKKRETFISNEYSTYPATCMHLRGCHPNIKYEYYATNESVLDPSPDAITRAAAALAEPHMQVEA